MATNSNESVEELLESGLNALDAGNFDDALSQWNLALKQEPENARAARLVADLEQLISDNRCGTVTVPSGEFVVIVEGEEDAISLIESGTKAVTQAFLDKRAADLAELEAANEELAGQVNAANAAALEAQKATVAIEAQIAELKAAQLVEAEARSALDIENRDRMRFRRLQQQQVADLELRMAERQAHEKTLLADIDQRAAERDALRTELEAGASALKAANEATAAATAERDAQAALLEAAALVTAERDGLSAEVEALKATAAEQEATVSTLNQALSSASEEVENVKTELGETRNGLASERAGLEVTLTAWTRVQAEVVALTASLGEASTTVANAETTIQQLEADKAAGEVARDELEKAKEEAEKALENAANDAATSADEVTRLAAELTKAASEAEEKVNAATSSLEESQAARSAMRTEMATIVQDLEKAKAEVARLMADAETQGAALAAKDGEAREAVEDAEAKATAAEAQVSELTAKTEASEKAAKEATAKITELEAAIADEKKAREHSAANTAAQAEAQIAEAHRTIGEAEAKVAEQTTEIARLTAELEQAKAAADDDSAAKAAESASEKAAALSGQVFTLQERIAELESALVDTESTDEVEQRIKAQEDALMEIQAQLMARDVSIAELQAQLETRDQAHQARQNASTLGAAEKDARVTELEGQLYELNTALASKAIQIQELQVQVRSASRSQESPLLQSEVDRLKVALSAAEGRARSADEYAEELAAQVEGLKASPIEMFVSGQYPSAGERSPTPSENLSISGQFAAAEAATQTAPHPISETALDSADRPYHNDTPVDSSAVSRLRDESLSPAERLSWLIDEQPYLAKDSTSSKQTLSAQAAFVLQNIDGNVSFADLIDIVGLPADETYAILLDLWERGVITSLSLEP